MERTEAEDRESTASSLELELGHRVSETEFVLICSLVFLCNRNFSSERESQFGFHLHCTDKNNNANAGRHLLATVQYVDFKSRNGKRRIVKHIRTCVRSKSFDQMALIFFFYSRNLQKR